MDRLKSILADKILDLSTETGDVDIRTKLDKIHRFRDFANACKSLMAKYPGIEDELTEMVINDNYDTVEASNRVDRLVDLFENPLSVEEEKIVSHFDSEDEKVVVEDKSNHNKITELKSNQSQTKKEEEESFFPTEEEMVVIKRNTTARRVVQVLAIVLAVFVLIFILKFVLLHWQTILIIVGILVILAILFVWYMRKQK